MTAYAYNNKLNNIDSYHFAAFSYLYGDIQYQADNDSFFVDDELKELMENSKAFIRTIDVMINNKLEEAVFYFWKIDCAPYYRGLVVYPDDYTSIKYAENKFGERVFL